MSTDIVIRGRLFFLIKYMIGKLISPAILETMLHIC